MLTIAIPTFNRCSKLCARLDELNPQLNEGVRIEIFDNGSTDQTQERLKHYLSDKIRFKSVAKNRGICRNFIRVFEEAEGEWIWMLSDDDPVLPDAVSRLFRKLEEAEAGVLAYKAQGNSIAQNAVYSSTLDFLSGQHVMDLSYISGIVYHRSAIDAGLPILAPSAYTLLPHSMLVFAALSKGVKIEVCSEMLVRPEEGEHRISKREFLLGLAVFPEFFEDYAIRNKVARQLRASSRWMIFSALAQIRDSEDLKRWRSMVAVAEASFAAHGAGWRHGALWTQWHTRADLRRELLLPVLRWLPDRALLNLSRRLARKTHQNHAITHRDAEI